MTAQFPFGGKTFWMPIVVFTHTHNVVCALAGVCNVCAWVIQYRFELIMEKSQRMESLDLLDET